MLDGDGLCQVVVLPKQFHYLASLAEAFGGAIGISQSGNVIHVNTGVRRFDIDANGVPIKDPLQERLL